MGRESKSEEAIRRRRPPTHFDLHIRVESRGNNSVCSGLTLFLNTAPQARRMFLRGFPAETILSKTALNLNDGISVIDSDHCFPMLMSCF